MSPPSYGWSRAAHIASVPLTLLALVASPLAAQELAPRAYWPAPVGTRIFGIGYTYSTGDVLVDPAVPIKGLGAETDSLAASFASYFGLAGRTASFQVDLPWVDTRFDGRLEGERGRIELSGLADLQARLAVNLIGAPAMHPEQFQEFRENPGSLLGASLRLQLPTGEYNPDRIANIGTSRWAVKPELGYIHRFSRRWTFDAALGVWVYGDNSDFRGQDLEQRPLLSAEVHLVRRIRPSLWVSVDLNGFYGGRTTLDGALQDNRQENSRIGATVVLPLARKYVVKLAWSTGLTTEAGGDFDVAAVAVQVVWR